VVLMRSLADQDVAELGGRPSVLTRQQADHVELNRLLGELAGVEPSQQDAVLRRIYRLVFPHAFAEESVLWPVLRRVLADGPMLTLPIECEHQAVNELVTELEGLLATAERRPEVLARLVAMLNRTSATRKTSCCPGSRPRSVLRHCARSACLERWSVGQHPA
jgi:hypothetical protein